MTIPKTRVLHPALRAFFAVSAVTILLGTAAFAPLNAEFKEQGQLFISDDDIIYQEFVPNADPADDLILSDIRVEKLPDPTPKPQAVAKMAGPRPPRYTGGGSPAEWMAAAGIAAGDTGYVNFVVSKESHWNPNATNASSGACGLVQALPCTKVPGNGYNPVDNLRWANAYAVSRYGSWSQAYDFWINNHWW